MITDRRRAAWIVVVLSFLVGGFSPARAAQPASIRVVMADDHLVANSYGGDVWLDPAAYIAAVGGAFDLRASRPSYTQPIDLYQFDPETNAVARDLPDDLLAGWWGLRAFSTVRITDAEGETVFQRTRGFCPNAGVRQRVGDEGPILPRYPLWCSSHPFMKGMVWGIDEGWAVGLLGDGGGIRASLSPGLYSLTVEIEEPYRDFFAIPPSDAVGEATLRVRKAASGFRREAEAEEQANAGAQTSGVPTDITPDPSTLPDLVALPAWDFDIRRRNNRELLSFAAMEWNAGPQALVVEGFRDQDEDVMRAYQYFYQDGEPVARARVGTMHFHAATGHFHWHFRQFTEYTLLDESKSEAVVSNKRSWCLAPTNPIDLTVPGAAWQPDSVGLSTACGYPSSLWVREVLPVGWGDTYYQSVAGQAFDITGLPNGTYFVQVRVNPLDRLYETDATNNVMLRRIRIYGPAGNRQVAVPPWRGIDTG